MWSMVFESRPALITSFLSSSTCGNVFSACRFSWARDGGLLRGGERRRKMGERKEDRRMREGGERRVYRKRKERERGAPHTSQSCLFLCASPSFQLVKVSSVLTLKRSVRLPCPLRLRKQKWF